MRRLPIFDYISKRDFDFIWVERKPAQLGADGLLFEFGTSPNESRADDGNDDAQPVVLDEQRRGDDDKTNAHHVEPNNVAKNSFAANHQREAESDDEESEDADEESEEIHSDQLMVVS